MKEKVILAYSGGLDTTVLIPWLKETYDYDIIAVCIDVGQGKETDGLEQKALKTGASKFYLLDVTEEFLQHYAWPTLKAGAVYESKYLLGTSIARPIIGKCLVDIAKKEEQMRERLYVMQTTYNSNWVVDFLFGSDDFSTFFSRLSSVNDITAYEKELVDELTQQKKNLDTQQKSLETARENLKSQKKSQEALQEKYIELKASQQEKIKDNQKESKEVSSAQKKIDAALSELISRAPSGGGGGGSYVPGDSSVGNAIAQKALTRRGCRYWWGANGPNYFDCSGLVYWAYNQAGVKLGRTTAAGYAGSGQSISRSQLQPGDVITFSYGSGVAHIGIYIGGGSFVHASGEGSGTVGQYADQCVKTAPLSGYWERYVYNYRRLY